MAKAGYGKQKGAGFEREVCKRLSLWITRGKRDDVFWRSAMSGGRATIGRKKGKDRSAQAGDISAVRKEGSTFIEHFHVECKFYRKLNLDNFLLRTCKGVLHKFWEKLLLDVYHNARLVERRRAPMLIVKENGMQPLVVTTSKGIEHLEKVWGIKVPPQCIVLGPQCDAYVFWFGGIFDERIGARVRPASNRPSRRRVPVAPVFTTQKAVRRSHHGTKQSVDTRRPD